ncbi:MAG: triose-phosphate isomerase [Candidatus Eisenbacteria bacterium]|uniref:Triosephosphate isomerase n=1 Tax=Eiseniibacteriota bacterium TaxID=2212470 RepID=A0A9D6QPE0_UNCEI|nr:triose-phosphate isomerase [Candidatus Eisenbacteria bacterium]MBI3539844.1 triose-phosphate isomerase [Candidatus Eisenbacteria bacterium]
MSAPWPRRPRLVAGNWKMNRTAADGAALARELTALSAAGLPCAVALCPPFTALESVGAVLRGGATHLGAQNLHPESKGAFTGEVSGPMLAALGCRFVIVGHSERRHGMGEDDATVARKARAALRDGLTPIVCVGETLAEREADKTTEVLVRQVWAVYEGLGADSRRTVVAYEPVWAIGTGRVATPDQARDAHRVIRATLDRVVGDHAGEAIAILYGGSVTDKNAVALFAENEVDGALVGGASLEAASFWRICAAAR